MNSAIFYSHIVLKTLQIKLLPDDKQREAIIDTFIKFKGYFTMFSHGCGNMYPAMKCVNTDFVGALEAIIDTFIKFNDACNFVSGIAFERRLYNKVFLQRIVYRDIREKFGLAAQYGYKKSMHKRVPRFLFILKCWSFLATGLGKLLISDIV